MSGIRFVHTDFLRLGAPLAGMAGAPAWLRQLATDSVRSAVRTLVEIAVSHDADFLLIAGGMVADTSDAEPVAQWLREQFEPLRSRGIRIVATVDSTSGHSALSALCDVVLRRGECLRVLAGRTTDHVDLTAIPESTATDADLLVSVAAQVLPQQHLAPAWAASQRSHLNYQARPYQRSQATLQQLSHDGSLALSAGAVQALNSTETGAFGCTVVDANLTARTLQAVFVPTDTLRFAKEELSMTQLATADTLVAEIVRASGAVRHADGRTLVVDWAIDGRIASRLNGVAELDEQRLLTRLRESLQSGHRGVWPHSVKFGSSSVLHLAAPSDLAAEEFMDVATGAVSDHDSRDIQGHHDGSMYLKGGPGVSASLVTGLSLLSRVA